MTNRETVHETDEITSEEAEARSVPALFLQGRALYLPPVSIVFCLNRSVQFELFDYIPAVLSFLFYSNCSVLSQLFYSVLFYFNCSSLFKLSCSIPAILV